MVSQYVMEVLYGLLNNFCVVKVEVVDSRKYLLENLFRSCCYNLPILESWKRDANHFHRHSHILN